MLTQKLMASGGNAGAPPGQQEYTTPGTYTWVCPAGVTSVSVVCVGGGGCNGDTSGNITPNNAGNLAYKNNIPVTPGVSYTVVVGAGTTTTKTSSYFIATDVVSSGTGSTYQAGDGGGGGRGGAGGYSGDGGIVNTTEIGSSGGNDGGSGAGGGGGAGGFAYKIFEFGMSYAIGAGGGVGILGQGDSGSGGIGFAGGNTISGVDGAGGSGGNGSGGYSYLTYSPPFDYFGNANQGYLFGGSGGWVYAFDAAISWNAPGAGGAVRIIWPGTTRSFPSTNTGNL